VGLEGDDDGERSESADSNQNQASEGEMETGGRDEVRRGIETASCSSGYGCRANRIRGVAPLSPRTGRSAARARSDCRSLRSLATNREATSQQAATQTTPTTTRPTTRVDSNTTGHSTPDRATPSHCSSTVLPRSRPSPRTDSLGQCIACAGRIGAPGLRYAPAVVVYHRMMSLFVRLAC
jgi:hypothetical protein